MIVGVDLAGPLSDDTVAEVRQALLAHRVVFFRGQHLDAPGQIAFASRLGPLTHAHPTLPATTEDPEIFDLDSLAGASANHWHTDVTFVERPPTFSVLRSVIIPEVGGDTMWANTVAGYQDLRPDLRVLADSLRAVHTNGNDYGRVDIAALQGPTERGAALLPALVRIDGLRDRASRCPGPPGNRRARPVARRVRRTTGGSPDGRVRRHPADMQAYVTPPENTVRWKWREGDVVVWDNRSTQHYAIADYGQQRRKVQRVTTAGEAAVGLDGSASTALQGDASRYYTAA